MSHRLGDALADGKGDGEGDGDADGEGEAPAANTEKSAFVKTARLSTPIPPLKLENRYAVIRSDCVGTFASKCAAVPAV